MSSSDFFELAVTSNFSFLEGGSSPEEMVEEAAKLGYEAIAITDKNSLSGVVRAHTAAKRAGIKIIVGIELSLLEYLPEKPAEDETIWITEDRYNLEHLLPLLPVSLFLYPDSLVSYKSVCSLLSKGKLRAPKGHTWLKLEDCFSELEIMPAAVNILNVEDNRVFECLRQLKNFFSRPNHPAEKLFSIFISKNYLANEVKEQKQVEKLASDLSIPLLASNKVLYHSNSRRKLQDILTCIRNRTTIQKAGFLLSQNSERFLKTKKEVKRLFRNKPQAIRQSERIAEQALLFSLDQLKYEYPEEICPKNKSPQAYLVDLTLAGARARFPQGISEEVEKQLEHEFKLIDELNYAKYFLTVYDIVSFAKSVGILCQGRGAAANSAVCYCLGITAVDPSRTRLLVERFISKERGEPPDIDIDFEHERREEVIQYIYNKFGRERAALVCAVTTYRRKSATREVGKALGLSIDTIETLQKIFYRRGDDDPVTNKEISSQGLNPFDPAIANCLELVDAIKGFPRHLTQHSSGFIISEKNLSEIISIENTAMPGRTMIAWDKDDIEQLGMLKIDVLGLGMLTCVRKALAMINSYSEDKTWDHQQLLLHNIPPEDPKVYDMLCAADTIGVFQVESRAQMNMLPRLRPRCFHDLVVEVAIVRPGPIQGGMVHPYLKRRKYKAKVTYPNEKIKEILGSTLGVPIFQEQIMELAVHGAGFTPGESDQLRRAIASWKRNRQALNHFGRKLIKGFLERGYKVEFAKQILGQIKGFSEYGFPQSHAASFALIVYTSSWIKHYHPAAFAAALINSQPMGFYHPSQIIQDAKKHEVEIKEIDAMLSDWDCSVHNQGNSLRLGMRLAQGLREEEAKKLVKHRGGSTSLRELWKQTGLKVDSLKCLARADAFRSLRLNRQTALWELKKLKDKEMPLFSKIANREETSKDNLPVITDNLEVLFDYQHTGHSLKAHPFEFVREKLSDYGVTKASALQNPSSTPHGKLLAIAGLVLVRQRPPTAKGVTFLTIEDESGWANLIIRPERYKVLRRIIMESSSVLAKGKVQRVDRVVNLLVENLISLKR